MKIIHCADVHLNSSLSRHFDKEAARLRNGELLKTFTDLLEYAKNYGVSAVLISGDLFDRDSGNKAIKESVYKAISLYPYISIFYLRGNHDLGVEGVAMPDNLFLFPDSWKTYSLGNKVKISGMELSDDVFSAYSLMLQEDDFNIVMLHGQTGFSDKNSDINLNHLKDHHIDYLALGHIHSYRKDQLDHRGTYCYAGCLEGRGFDEAGDHGFVLLDIDEVSGSYSSSFIPFARHLIYRAEVDLSAAEDSLDAARMIKEEVSSFQADSYVEIILKGDISADVIIDEPIIFAQIKDMFHYVKIKNQLGIKVDYSAYEKDESLKGEFVRLVQMDKSLSEEQKSRIIYTGINALAGKEF